MPRWVVGLLVAAFAMSLVAVAFLLGRVTAPAPPAGSAPVAGAGSTASALPDSPAVLPPSDPVGSPLSGAPDYGTASSYEPPGAPAAPTALAADPGGGGPDAAAITAYFAEMDAVAGDAKAGQDPQALASSILNQAISGNMGGIDGLIATQRGLEARLGQIVPPPSCREHHQRSVSLFGRAVTLLDRTRDAMTGQGATDLASVAAEGRAIEQEARAVDALANSIRRAAGLPTVS